MTTALSYGGRTCRASALEFLEKVFIPTVFRHLNKMQDSQQDLGCCSLELEGNREILWSSGWERLCANGALET